MCASDKVMEMQTRDEDLVKAAIGGDETAFSILLERHYDRIFRIAAGVLGSRAEAEDVTQDICLSLPKKLSQFRGEAKFTTWLHRVVINASRDRLRRMETHSRKASGWGDWELNRQAANQEAKEARSWLSDAMSRLSADLRETVTLVLGEDMTHKDASDVLGVSEGTVSWRMSEVKKALAEMARREEMLR